MIDWMFDSDWGFLGFLACLLLGALLLIGALFAVILPIAYYGERASCEAFGRQAARETRFVHLIDPGIPLSWDCLVRTADGRWISRSQLRSVDES